MRGRGPGNEARDEPEIYGRPCRLLALFTVNFRWPVVYSNLQSSFAFRASDWLAKLRSRSSTITTSLIQSPAPSFKINQSNSWKASFWIRIYRFKIIKGIKKKKSTINFQFTNTVSLKTQYSSPSSSSSTESIPTSS